MNDQDKFVALVRLRDMIYFGVRPTLRQSGLTRDLVQELTNEDLIRLLDRRQGDEPDRFVIQEISPAGFSFISQQKALRNR